MRRVKQNHLYRDGAKASELRAFERRYGTAKGKYIYGATVGEVRRERLSKKGGDNVARRMTKRSTHRSDERRSDASARRDRHRRRTRRA